MPSRERPMSVPKRLSGILHHVTCARAWKGTVAASLLLLLAALALTGCAEPAAIAARATLKRLRCPAWTLTRRLRERGSGDLALIRKQGSEERVVVA